MSLVFPFVHVAKKVSFCLFLLGFWISIAHHSFVFVFSAIGKLPSAGQKKREALDKLLVVCPHCKSHEKRCLLEQHILSSCPTSLI